MTPGRALTVLIATILLGACAPAPTAGDSGFDGGTVPNGVCAESPDFAGTICPQIVGLATARLGWLHWPVTSTLFRSSMCPPNARCLLVLGNQGWVIFTFAVGDPVMIHVGPSDTGEPGLVASAPEPVPDWLLDELRGISG